ncbi:D-lyxose/D-mannose family sugar isomerase [Tetragenococcus halophilus]|uniref:D-lyxose/D-mannose family sugar isomerase n=1 Tax=Tetragenococcus halophilus TaxID=51669 RepID=UPI0025B0882C|nr:D-lyxose/D-mannose family sugar isomerase [Tetragenococcus halophilus]
MSKPTQEYMNKVKEIYEKSKIVLTNEEIAKIDYTDFGLNNWDEEGLNLILYVNNDRYCAKEMALLPNQTCPEHMHPDWKGNVGKQETFRCRWGDVYLYIEDSKSLNLENDEIKLPEKNSQYYTASKGYYLTAGEQYTIPPKTKHWFQAGDRGAVISEFSSPSYDEYDVFTNPNVKREVRDR